MNHIIPYEQFARPMHEQIAEKFGNDPSVMDDLLYEVRQVQVGNTGQWLNVSLAYPIGESVTAENVCMTFDLVSAH